VQEAGADGLETSVWNREVNPTNVDLVAGIHKTSKVSIYVDSHGPRNMAYGHLVGLEKTCKPWQ
jgi:hypothetical protein